MYHTQFWECDRWFNYKIHMYIFIQRHHVYLHAFLSPCMHWSTRPVEAVEAMPGWIYFGAYCSWKWTGNWLLLVLYVYIYLARSVSSTSTVVSIYIYIYFILNAFIWSFDMTRSSVPKGSSFPEWRSTLRVYFFSFTFFKDQSNTQRLKPRTMPRTRNPIRNHRAPCHAPCRSPRISHKALRTMPRTTPRTIPRTRNPIRNHRAPRHAPCRAPRSNHKALRTMPRTTPRTMPRTMQESNL